MTTKQTTTTEPTDMNQVHAAFHAALAVYEHCSGGHDPFPAGSPLVVEAKKGRKERRTLLMQAATILGVDAKKDFGVSMSAGQTKEQQAAGKAMADMAFRRAKILGVDVYAGINIPPPAPPQAPAAPPAVSIQLPAIPTPPAPQTVTQGPPQPDPKPTTAKTRAPRKPAKPQRRATTSAKVQPASKFVKLAAEVDRTKAAYDAARQALAAACEGAS